MNLKQCIKQLVYRHELTKTIFEETIQKARINKMSRELHENGWNILKLICSVLDHLGMQYFADSGTLLGMIREGDFIGNDTDIDMGIIKDEHFTKDSLDEAMASINMKLHHTFYYDNQPVEISYVHGTVIIDFFLYMETFQETHYIQYCFARDIMKEYPESNLFDVYEANCQITGIKRIDLHNLSLPVPMNAEEYLASIYTDEWRTPISSWNYLAAPRIHILEGQYGIRK